MSLQRFYRPIRIQSIKVALVALVFFTSLTAQSALAAYADYFITTWKTDNPGTPNDTSITVPMVGGPYDVDWDSDGTFDETVLSGPVTHVFPNPGTYTIRIRGTYDSIRFKNSGDKEKILSIDQWGTNAWTTMYQAFWGAVNLTVPATDTPDFSAVIDLTSMFDGATAANPNTSGWDTSAAVFMELMFYNATSFDQDIGSWDVTALEWAFGMFDGVILSTANYDSLLIGWNAQTLKKSVEFSGGNSTYCSAEASAARANMINSDLWFIDDGGQQCPPTDPDVAPDLTSATDTGVSDSDNLTNVSTPAFAVACSASSNTITLYTDNPALNTAIGSHVCTSVGAETATATTALNDGLHNITYTDKIGGAESGHSPPLAVTIDTIAPVTPTCSTTPNPAGNGDAVTTTCTGVEGFTTLQIPDMACSSTSADVINTVVCTGTVGSGTGEINTPDDTVSVTDPAGNTNTDETTGLVIDLIFADSFE